MAAFLAALFSRFRGKFCTVTVFGQIGETFIHLENHIAAFSAVSAVRTAVGHEKLPTEAHMTVSAFSGADKYLCSVCKHENSPSI